MDGVDKLQGVDTAEIDSVLLSLYVAHTWVEEEAICTLHTIDSAWVENEVCWDFPAIGKEWDLYPFTSNDDSFNLMKGGDIGFEPIGFSKMAAAGQWQATNITQTIKEYLHAPEKNNGVMVRSGAELQPHDFFSSQAETVALRPKLVFYTNGTAVLEKSSHTVQSALEIETLNTQCRIFVREKSDFTLKISTLLGRKLFSYTGNQEGWVHIPMASLPNSVLIATLESGGKTTTKHFINR